MSSRKRSTSKRNRHTGHLNFFKRGIIKNGKSLYIGNKLYYTDGATVVRSK